MLTCTRRIQFCAGHRVFGHESKCANAHGHNYVALFEAGADQLDSIGRIVDFSVLKDRFGGWIEVMWDHGFLVYCADTGMRTALEQVGGTQKTFVMETNPTAENMAEFLLRFVCPTVLSGTGVTVRRVTLWETENCFAEATLT